MTEPRTPDDQPIDVGTAPASPLANPSDGPTQAWPSLAGPAPVVSAGAPTQAAGAPAWPAETPPTPAPTEPSSATPVATSPFEPATSLPSTRVESVGETGSVGGPVDQPRGRSRLRWAVALAAVVVVAVGSFLIVSLVGGRPSTSPAMGYMPLTTVTYAEVRLDLPGDQRQKLASFLQAFPGFSDQSAIEPKLDELFDRIVRAATKDTQTWTTDIKPWFGGQVALGSGVPQSPSAASTGMAGANDSLAVVTITDRTKAVAWLTKTTDGASITRSTYGDADLFVPAEGGDSFAVAINDKVMLAGTPIAVKAAVDLGGKGTLDQSADVKAAVATLAKDYVVFGVTRTRALADAVVKMVATSQPGLLEQTQIDETVLGLVPAWQASTGRFEGDAFVMSSTSPSWNIGFDGANQPSDLLGHVPAKSIVYLDSHDVGPALTAVIAKFRPLPEAKPFFSQFDQAMSVLGGSDAVFGWWGDTAFVVSPLDDGTIGAGLVIHPRDAAAADRLFTTLGGFIVLGGGSAGVTTRTEDHNGTKITIVDVTSVPGVSTAGLPPGYKAELAWATNKDVTVIGYGSAFVKAVLDAGPGASLGDDARFKSLLGRVGSDNLGVTFVDLAALRSLLEPLVQPSVPADKWAYYTKEIQPYLKPFDAVISNVRKDGGNDHSTNELTVH